MHHTPHTPLPIDLSKRDDMVVAICISKGFVNRDLLAHYYGLSKLQASTLLRDFLEQRVHDIRRDDKNNGYILIGYPKRRETHEHRNTH
jgi:hypothetical protein